MFLPGESQGCGSLLGCAYGVAQSRTRLKPLSSSKLKMRNSMRFVILQGRSHKRGCKTCKGDKINVFLLQVTRGGECGKVKM